MLFRRGCSVKIDKVDKDQSISEFKQALILINFQLSLGLFQSWSALARFCLDKGFG